MLLGSMCCKPIIHETLILSIFCHPNLSGSINSQPRYLYSDVLAGSKPAGRNVPTYRPQPTPLAYNAPRSSLLASTTTGPHESIYGQQHQPSSVLLDGAKPSDVNIPTTQPNCAVCMCMCVRILCACVCVCASITRECALVYFWL